MAFWERSKKGKHIVAEQSSFLRVVGDAAIANGSLGGGKAIPLLIIEASTDSKLAELIRVHEFIDPGDVDTVWGLKNDANETVFLNLNFKRPVEFECNIEFEIFKQGILVDQILNTKCTYIQVGKVGDRFITNPEAPRIIVEVAAEGFEEKWSEVLLKHTIKHFKDLGNRRQVAKRMAKEHIETMRSIQDFRMP